MKIVRYDCCPYKVASFRLEARDLLRSPLFGAGVADGSHIPPLCPSATWRAVAPWLSQDRSGRPGESSEGENSMAAPCVFRAADVRAALEEAIDLKPELEAVKALTADLVSPEMQLALTGARFPVALHECCDAAECSHPAQVPACMLPCSMPCQPRIDKTQIKIQDIVHSTHYPQ